jgi:hypothetical protein
MVRVADAEDALAHSYKITCISQYDNPCMRSLEILKVAGGVHRRQLLWPCERCDSLGERKCNSDQEERIIYRSLQTRPEPKLLHAPEDYLTHPARVQLATIWMEKCRRNHETCNLIRGYNNPLPKRVLDIANHVFLYESRPGEVAPYATLSYCWGKGVPLTTTTRNIAHHRAEIPLSAVPRTLRESIVFAKALGFRYIWIDALCIIQDSEQDWAEQAADMTRIYQGCSINIAVSDAPSSDAGLAVALDESSLLVVSYNKTGHGSTSIRLATQLSSNRLFSRGWTLQETLVSVATIQVGWTGMSWVCSTVACTEEDDWKQSSARFTEMSKHPWAVCSLLARGSLADSGRSWGRTGGISSGGYPIQLKHWYWWVADFSRRALTYPGDKLPAIAGIAAQFSSWFDLTYAAGIWKEDIHVGLCWRTPILSPGTLVRHTDRGPSWSWVSVDGDIEFPGMIHDNYSDTGICTTGLGDLEVLDVLIDEEYAGTFGRVLSGRIEAMATMYQGTMVRDDATWLIRCSQGDLYCLVDEAESVGDACGSYLCWLAQACSIGYAQRRWANKRPDLWFYLILKEVGGSGSSKFTRIGLLEHSRDLSEDGTGTRRKITLL